jgi:hypothetical protein
VVGCEALSEVWRGFKCSIETPRSLARLPSGLFLKMARESAVHASLGRKTHRMEFAFGRIAATGPRMSSWTRQTWSHWLAVLAVSLQVLLPGAMAPAHADDVSLAGLLCHPSGQSLTAEAREALEEFAELTGQGEPDDRSMADHCPLCALSHGATLPLPIVVAGPKAAGDVASFQLFETRFVHLAQGPPLGPRAPPAHV